MAAFCTGVGRDGAVRVPSRHILDGPYFPTETQECAKWWTKCPHTVVAELREKLRTVFGLDLPVLD
jgi:hypothetical protein